MNFKIEKATGKALLSSTGRPKIKYPLENLNVGEMFKAPIEKRLSIYNAIKYRTKYTGELKGKIFTVRTMDKKTIACIRKS